MLNSKEELKKAEAELLKKVDSKNSINQTSYDDIVSKYLLSEEDTILLDKFVSENNIDIIDDLDDSTISKHQIFCISMMPVLISATELLYFTW